MKIKVQELVSIIRSSILDAYNPKILKGENKRISKIITTDGCEKLGDKSSSLAVITDDEHLYAIFVVEVV